LTPNPIALLIAFSRTVYSLYFLAHFSSFAYYSNCMTPSLIFAATSLFKASYALGVLKITGSFDSSLIGFVGKGFSFSG